MPLSAVKCLPYLSIGLAVILYLLICYIAGVLFILEIAVVAYDNLRQYNRGSFLRHSFYVCRCWFRDLWYGHRPISHCLPLFMLLCLAWTTYGWWNSFCTTYWGWAPVEHNLESACPPLPPNFNIVVKQPPPDNLDARAPRWCKNCSTAPWSQKTSS